MAERTTILFGPPGCGKTTSLLNEVEHSLNYGIPIEQIGYFAFSRKAASEAMTRARERFGFQPKNYPWFRTLHSAAFQILGLRREEVMSTEHYIELGRALGSFTFKGLYDETTERPPPGGGLGDRALSVYSLARAQGISVEQAWRQLPKPDINLLDSQRFADAVVEYKRSTGLIDFSDFMDLAQQELDIEVMFLDEAQDLTHQQWEFARRIGKRARSVIIAGDDDQCIYQWAGADLRLFLELKANVVVLPQSYRLPQLIYGVADDLARRIRIRKSKQWRPRPELGVIEYLNHADQAPLRGEGSWLLLTRHRAQQWPLVQICRDQGVVYNFNGQWSNEDASVRAVVDYERLRRGEQLSLAAGNRVIRFISGMTPLGREVEAVRWGMLAFPFRGAPSWMDALTGLSPEQREYIRRLRREGESLSNPGRVVISTIHGAKGGEADNVLILPDFNRRTENFMLYDPDQEARVWYVGVSRAKQRLFMVSPRTSRFYSI